MSFPHIQYDPLLPASILLLLSGPIIPPPNSPPSLSPSSSSTLLNSPILSSLQTFPLNEQRDAGNCIKDVDAASQQNEEADPGEPILTSNSAETKTSNKKAGDMDGIIAQDCGILSKRRYLDSGMAAQEDSGRCDYTLEG